MRLTTTRSQGQRNGQDNGSNMEEEFQEFLDAFHPQPLEFFKKTEALRRDKPLGGKKVAEILNLQRSTSFVEYFPKEVFSKNCTPGAAKPPEVAFGDNVLGGWNKSSLSSCMKCTKSVLCLDQDEPCWFLKKEITLHLFVWVSSQFGEICRRLRTLYPLIGFRENVNFFQITGNPKESVQRT